MKRLNLLFIISLLFPLAFAQTTELRIAWWGSQDRHDRTIKAIEMFKAEHPDVEIVFEPSGWDDHWTKMTTQAAGNNLPDIMQHDYAFLAEWASRGLIIPLDSYMGNIIDTSNISEAVLDGGKVDGQLYGLNLGTNSMNIIIDVDAFEAAGVDLPAPDWTWADFEEVAMKLREARDGWAIGAGLIGDQLWKALYLGHGQWAYTDDGTALGYEDDQPFIDYITMIKRLMDAGAMVSRAEDVAEFAGQSIEALPIVSGRTAMDMSWSNQIVAVWTAAGAERNLKLWPLPRPEGGQSENYVKPSMFWAITKDSKNPELAAEFLNYFTNSLEVNEVLLAERGVPISSAIREGLTPLLSPAQVEMFDFMTRVESDSSPIRPPDPPGHSDIVANVYTPIIMDQFFYGQVPAEQAVQMLREEASRILQQNQ